MDRYKIQRGLRGLSRSVTTPGPFHGPTKARHEVRQIERAPRELPTSNVAFVPTIERAEVVLHGHRVVYRVSGDLQSGRPVLLLVHGMASSSATWDRVVPKLAMHATVVAPDLPGHGQSDKPRQDYSLGAQAN